MSRGIDGLRWPMALLIAASMIGAFVTWWPDAARADPAQMPACTWRNLGSSSRDLFHTASAMDTDANQLYVYGGVDGGFRAQSQVEVADLSSPALAVTHRPVTAPGARALAGAAGAYRAKGKDADDSAVYFVGGMTDPEQGQAGNDVQRYVVKARKWEAISPAGASAFGNRAFAAAAYDPIHDVIWVTGGIAACALMDVAEGKPCPARPMETVYLSFDPATGAAKWNGSSAGTLQLYGHSMVFDPSGQRMLLFGGTSDIQTGSGTVRALSLVDPDPARAAISTLATSGTAPAVFFHGAAYDTSREWLIAYGGTTRNFMQSSESLNTGTYRLDLVATPPRWGNVQPVGAPGERVAGAFVFDPLHAAGIVTLGRKKVSLTGSPPVPSASVQRTTWALQCVDVQPSPPYPGPTTPSPGVPTTGPGTPTRTPARPTTTAAPPEPGAKACPGLDRRVPQAVISGALANPAAVRGWGQLCYPSLPRSPYNIRRSWLGLDKPVPYSPQYNSVVYKCGCP